MKQMANSILFFVVIVVSSCSTDNQDAKQIELKQEIKELHKRIDSLSSQFASHQMDTVLFKEDVKTIPPRKKIQDEKPSPNPAGPTSKTHIAHKPPSPQLSGKQPLQQDTVYHYYTNGKISLKIFPIVNNEKVIQLFDLYGNKTYEDKEIHKSYSKGFQYRFHENGAVSSIEESFNPGASMYMYFATMTFDSVNQPLLRTESKYPSTLEEELNKQPLFWNKSKGEWQIQEIVIETNQPLRK